MYICNMYTQYLYVESEPIYNIDKLHEPTLHKQQHHLRSLEGLASIRPPTSEPLSQDSRLVLDSQVCFAVNIWREKITSLFGRVSVWHLCLTGLFILAK